MADDKKEKIYGAVLELFKEGKSIKSIKVSEIADRAGIGKGSIYLHFASKDDVIVEAAKYFFDTWLKPFKEYIIDDSKPFKDTVMEYIDIHLDLLNEYMNFFNPQGGSDYINVFNSDTLPGTIEVFQRARQKYLNVLEKILQVGIKRNEISNADNYSVNMAAQSIMMTMKYLGCKDIFNDLEEDYSIEECKEKTYDMILRICR